MTNKLVDVIIPTYKRSVFLKRAIESVLSQTYSNVNVIIVDDNNAGDFFRKETQKTMQQYSTNNRVIYLQHETNKNGAAARNTGIKYSNADFIAFLDDDDFFMPKKIENQMNIINKLNDEWGGVFCFHVRRYKRYAYAAYSVDVNDSGNYCYEFLSGKTSTPSSTLLIKREVFNSIGFFDETFFRHQDLEFLVRFYRKFKMAISPNFDTYMQIEGFRNYPNSVKANEIKLKFLNKYYLDIADFNEFEQREIYKNQWFEVACLYLKDRDSINARKLFRKYIFIDNQTAIKDYLKVFFFLILGYLPFLKKSIAYLLGSTKYRQFSKIN